MHPTPAYNSSIEADRKFLQLAQETRSQSDDPKAAIMPSSGVGCVIVKDGEILSTSANVLPPIEAAILLNATGGQISPADRYHLLEHAERAAIYKAISKFGPIHGSDLYCSRFPCSDCARAIAWSGIRRVILAEDLPNPEELNPDARHWVDSQRAAARIFEAAGIQLTVIR